MKKLLSFFGVAGIIANIGTSVLAYAPKASTSVMNQRLVD
ncbi:lipoprotein [Spiroplasma clarkii]|uniref:Uncharacterized protein n=1 Tax=Spiroplasma clarkii TaxID=2139 RepID=A0A2K8KLV9_9MOLU|nr:lipoprotein [Spiroplasma clarkii]ATX71629.1 hypothetical protein SCLAR_v1c13310 [Spiroplasma clarkii]